MTGNTASKLEKMHRREQKKSGGYDHWHTQTKDDVLWLHFDKKDSSANTLDAAILGELDQILDSIQDQLPKALVLQSLKAGGFCAGADIKQFVDFSADEAADMLHDGHEVLDRLENLDIPTVAVVHGHCLGGGLELALACNYRIGVHGSLQMGFPEIRLGLHPGLGGTFRLIELINPVSAMTMMLTGKPAHGRQCKSQGLVDQMVEERHVGRAVKAVVRKRRKRSRGVFNTMLNLSPVRRLASRKMQSQAAEKAPPEHYPAPNALIDLWVEHGGDRDAMQKAEIDSFARLLATDTSKNLVRVFFLQQTLKSQARKDSGIERVHVIGAGAMGGDIAGWCAMNGCQVTLSDIETETIAKAIANTARLCRSKHKSSIETREVLDRLVPDPEGKGIAQADLVIEAVPEELELKAKIYNSVEPQLKDSAILASNTSSIPLEKLADKLEQAERFVGIHFFNPVAQMQIVEVVSHKKSSKENIERAVNFTGQIGKLPVNVSSYPGFLVNRALTPYLLEAIVLLDEGVEKEQIDQAAKDFGMPMGPVELADQVGLDICLHVAEVLIDALDKSMPAVPDWLSEKVEQGHLGKKSGQGFYQWKNGKADKDDPEALDSKTSAEISDRLVLPMLNACVECYREKVVSDLDHLDGAMIFATGFAPFTGGPIHYARTRGVDEIVDRLEELQQSHGDRFAPDPGWKEIKDSA